MNHFSLTRISLIFSVSLRIITSVSQFFSGLILITLISFPSLLKYS